jgi:hypothetical protein
MFSESYTSSWFFIENTAFRTLDSVSVFGYKPTQLVPIDRPSLYLRTPAPTQYKMNIYVNQQLNILQQKSESYNSIQCRLSDKVVFLCW